MTSNLKTTFKKAARETLWRQASLSKWKLDPCKQEIYNQILACNTPQFVIEANRKLGKSYLFCLIAIETCIKNPGERVNYACPTGKMAVEIVVPIFNEICADAPEDLKPTYAAQTGHITFPNGAYVVLGGCEDEQKADRFRGPKAVLNIIDEGGFIPCLEYAVDSVLVPQTLRNGGLTLLGSTPPKSPAHDFCKMADAAMANGAYAHRTIYSPGIEGIPDPEQFVATRAKVKNLSVEEYKATSEFQREYMARRIIDEKSALIPEFIKVESSIVTKPETPVYRHCFVSADPAYGKHHTGVLFGYADFVNQTLVIEGELLLHRINTQDLAKAILDKEKELWGAQVPYLRVIDDVHGRLIADLRQIDQKLHFICAEKHDRDAGVALTRTYVAGQKVIIHPNCVQLIHQMRSATVNDKGDLQETKADGHYDLAGAALIYMVRAWHKHKVVNPYPSNMDPYTRVTYRRDRPKNDIRSSILGKTHLGRRIIRKKD